MWLPLEIGMNLDQHRFEDDVRRLARALYPRASGGDPELHDNRERDCIFVGPDFVRIIEATVSRRADNIKDNCHKTKELILHLRKKYPDRVVTGLIVVQSTPTADQTEMVKKYAQYQIRLQSFSDFRRLLYDAEDYIAKRRHYRFGSSGETDGLVGAPQLTNLVDLDLIDLENRDLISLESLRTSALNGSASRSVLLGDFGSGKSTTLFQVWSRVADECLDGKESRLPIFLNLRDHSGQTEPVEALERHARRIGYPNPHSLVAAFNAGEVVLFLDGVDELTPVVRLSSASQKLRETRKKTVRLVRDFIKTSPGQTPIFVSSRSQYFDSESEMKESLGITSDWKILTLNEFSFDQMKKLFVQLDGASNLPSWVPGRPLLLVYLASRNLLSKLSTLPEELQKASAWSQLLDMICSREASRVDMEASDARRVLERVGTLAGRNASGLGPIEPEAILQSLSSITGSAPDVDAEQLVLRLPGLGPAPAEPSKRIFIDETLADVARAGDVIRFIENPFSLPSDLFFEAAVGLDPLAVELVALRLKSGRITSKQVGAALQRACGTSATATLALSIIASIKSAEIDLGESKFTISDAICKRWVVGDSSLNVSNVIFSRCLFETIELSQKVDWGKASVFEDCIILRCIGRTSLSDLPKTNFKNCEVEAFSESMENTNQILEATLDPIVKVVLACLEKLFFQPGRGRDESAFPRGLDGRLRPLVTDALELIRSEGLAHPYRTGGKAVWIPERSAAPRVRAIFAAPASSSDKVLQRARNLS